MSKLSLGFVGLASVMQIEVGSQLASVLVALLHLVAAIVASRVKSRRVRKAVVSKSAKN